MRTTFLCLLILFSLTAYANEEGERPTKATVNTTEPVTYVAAIVRRGDNWEQDSLRAFELQEKHLKFLENLKSQDKLIASGPLTSSSDARGLYVFNVKSIEEAISITSQDEAVSSGWIKMDFHIWASRDYSTAETTVIADEESDDDGSLLGMAWQPALLTIFTLWIVVLAFRTFRMKASV